MFEKIDLNNGNVVARIRADFFGGLIQQVSNIQGFKEQTIGYGKFFCLGAGKETYTLGVGVDDPDYTNQKDPLTTVKVGVKRKHLFYATVKRCINNPSEFDAIFTVDASGGLHKLGVALLALISGEKVS